jgi:hypothetical protein
MDRLGTRRFVVDIVIRPNGLSAGSGFGRRCRLGSQPGKETSLYTVIPAMDSGDIGYLTRLPGHVNFRAQGISQPPTFAQPTATLKSLRFYVAWVTRRVMRR